MIEELISQAAIQERIKTLGQQISQDYAGKSIDLVGVLKGSIFIVSDLARSIEVPLTLDFMRLSSYEGSKSSGQIRLEFDVTQPIEGKHVLLVEDIVDTGLTMDYLIESIRLRSPASLKVCSLLHKPDKQKSKAKLDYVGFEIDDHFVVGYGLDYNGLYRNLPYIGIYKG